VNIGIGFHGSVDFKSPASVSGIIVNTSKILAQKGYIFRIFCDLCRNECLKKSNFKNISLYPYFNMFFHQNARFYLWHKILWISYKLANSYADILHIHQKSELVIGFSFFKNAHIPLIFHINSHPEAWKGARYERAFRKSDLVIAASRFIEESLIKKFPFLIGKTEVLYNGVDTEIFSPKEKDRPSFPKKSIFNVFFAGNIWLEKGFDVLLKTAQKLNKKNIKFLIAGTFSPEKNLLHREFKENSPENVEYLGCIKHDDLAKYYASADITIVPSRWQDPCPLVVMESMSCGTPVIGSRIGGIPELIDDGRTGLLVTSGSVNELKDAILWCKIHPERLREMGVEARKKAIRFDWNIISEQLEKIYEELLS